jgi:methionine-rich copper-binding protein CopC
MKSHGLHRLLLVRLRLRLSVSRHYVTASRNRRGLLLSDDCVTCDGRKEEQESAAETSPPRAAGIARGSGHSGPVCYLGTGSPRLGEQVAAQVVAQFSEELVSKSNAVKVVNARGERVNDGNSGVDLKDPDYKTMIATILKLLADGTYTVQWHALLTDGDAYDGTFGITVNSDATHAQPAPCYDRHRGGRCR